MEITEKHLNILTDIHSFSRISRYYGLLPEKHAVLYDSAALKELMDADLVEQGNIQTGCSDRLIGYRLAGGAIAALKEMGVFSDFEQPDSDPSDDCPEPLNIMKLLRDVHYLSGISKNYNIAPRPKLEEYGYTKKELKQLCKDGYLLLVKMKGKNMETKGCILSHAGRELLRKSGTICPMEKKED